MTPPVGINLISFRIFSIDCNFFCSPFKFAGKNLIYNDNLEIDSNSFNQKATNNDLLAGGEGLVESSETIGGFSETTTASFGVDFLVGAVDGASSEATAFSYQMGIGLETSFTGEDSLSATIDIGDAAGDALALDDTDNVLTLDGLTYTFPVGGATLMVGDSTDISAVYPGA